MAAAAATLLLCSCCCQTPYIVGQLLPSEILYDLCLLVLISSACEFCGPKAKTNFALPSNHRVLQLQPWCRRSTWISPPLPNLNHTPTAVPFRNQLPFFFRCSASGLPGFIFRHCPTRQHGRSMWLWVWLQSSPHCRNWVPPRDDKWFGLVLHDRFEP